MEEIKELKKIMEVREFSHEFVARKIGVGVRTIFRWTHSKTEPKSNPIIMQLRKFIGEYK